MRSCQIDVDKTTGTQWPPDSVHHQGNLHSLADIYQRTDFSLTVERGEADLPLPATGATFDLAQLHAFMLEHRRPAADGWRAHVLIVPNIRYVSGWRTVQPIGVMYDWRAADTNDMPREGCAMSYRAVSQLDERAYLRTVAHELGHVFNLLHPKHEDPPQPIGTTIMNQTSDLQLLGNFPENISFDFTPANRSWLRDGPSDFVRPGGRPFGSRPADPADLAAGDMVLPNSAGLQFSISTRRESYGIGEPFFLRFSLRNVGGQPLLVDPSLTLHTQTVVLDVVDPMNRTRRFRPAYVECREAEAVTLAPDQELLGNSAVSFDARGQMFPQAGSYRLRAAYASSATGQLVAASAKELTVEITKPANADEIALADTLSVSGAGLFFVLRGGRHLAKAADAWRRVLDTHGDAPFAQAVKVVLAQDELSRHRGKAAGRRACDLLESAADTELDFEQRAERAQLLNAAAGRIGRRKAAANARQLWKDLAVRIDPTASPDDE